MAAEPLETELKIPVGDLEPVRRALHRSGAELVHPAAREVNLLLDSNDRRLCAAGSLLRLREHGDTRLLTFKGPARFSGAVKERAEYETVIHDLEGMQAILGQLGLVVVMRYEKDREEWRVDDASVLLDRTPMGDFVEVEGDPGEIQHVARELGLAVDQAVRGSYVSLWIEHRERHPELGLPVDMVFDE